jgi:hypothetical protein
MVEEDQAIAAGHYCGLMVWVGTQRGKDVPNLMNGNLRHGRLGDVIDEVLGVKRKAPAPRGPPSECGRRGVQEEEPEADGWRLCNCA